MKSSPESFAAMFAKIISALFGKLLLLILIVLLIGALPVWRHSARWGYIPAALIAVALVVVYAFARLGRL
ncbi:MAG: DUF3309 family protein [Methylocella sp.]